MATLAASFCTPLADAFEGLVAVATQFRVMEVAARLMTYKSPIEGVKKHAAELNQQVFEALQRAAEMAKSNGNQPYVERLNALSAAVKVELMAMVDKNLATVSS